MLAKLSKIYSRLGFASSVGIDISSTSIKYFYFKKSQASQDTVSSMRWGTLSVPEGVLDSGQITDRSRLVTLLKECQEKTGAKHARLSLPEESGYIFETEIKQHLSQKEMHNLLEFRLAEKLPLPLDEIFYDFSVLPASSSDAQHDQVVVAAYAQKTIQAYHEACVEAGFASVQFEAEAQAIARSCVPSHTAGATLLVDLGKKRTGVAVVHKDVALYNTKIKIGGDRLSFAMRKFLGADTSEKELETLKNTHGLLRGQGSSDVYDSLLATLSAVKDQILVNMQFWHGCTDGDESRRISQVILCGGGANTLGLVEYLNESIDVPVVTANVWQHVLSFDQAIPPMQAADSHVYATAIGLTLGS